MKYLLIALVLLIEIVIKTFLLVFFIPVLLYMYVKSILVLLHIIKDSKKIDNLLFSYLEYLSWISNYEITTHIIDNYLNTKK